MRNEIAVLTLTWTIIVSGVIGGLLYVLVVLMMAAIP